MYTVDESGFSTVSNGNWKLQTTAYNVIISNNIERLQNSKRLSLTPMLMKVSFTELWTALWVNAVIHRNWLFRCFKLVFLFCYGSRFHRGYSLDSFVKHLSYKFFNSNEACVIKQCHCYMRFLSLIWEQLNFMQNLWIRKMWYWKFFLANLVRGSCVTFRKSMVWQVVVRFHSCMDRIWKHSSKRYSQIWRYLLLTLLPIFVFRLNSFFIVLLWKST